MRRRRAPARVQEGRGGCFGGLLGAVLGLLAAYFVYTNVSQTPYLIPVIGLAGLLFGAQIGQWISSRKSRAGRRR